MLAARAGRRGPEDLVKDDPQQMVDWYYSFIPRKEELGL